MSELDRNNLKFVLHGLRLAGCTVDDAHSRLLVITGEELFSRQLIQFFFKTWDMEKKEKEEEQENDGSDLSYMPDPVKRNITKFLDLQSRLSFRDVCSRIRGIVDIEKLHIDKFVLAMDRKTIEITSDGKLLRRFTNFRRGCIIEQDEKMRLVPSGDQWYEAKKYLDKILNWRNLSIGKFQIESISNSRMPPIDEMNLSDLLLSEPNNRILRVKSLHWTRTGNCLMSMLMQLQPGYLENLSFGPGTVQLEDQTFKTEQWRKLKKFSAGQINLSKNKIEEAICHFHSCKFHIIELGYPLFETIFEGLLKNPKFCQMIIYTQINQRETKLFENHIPRFGVTMTLEMNRIWLKGPAYVEERDKNDEMLADNGINFTRHRHFLDHRVRLQ